MMLTGSYNLLAEILKYGKETKWKIFSSFISHIYGLLHQLIEKKDLRLSITKPYLMTQTSILPHIYSLALCTFLTTPRGCRFPAEQREVSEKFLWTMEP